MIALLAPDVWGDHARTRTCGVEVKDAPGPVPARIRRHKTVMELPGEYPRNSEHHCAEPGGVRPQGAAERQGDPPATFRETHHLKPDPTARNRVESWIDTQFIGFTCASLGACRRSKALVVACSVSVEVRKARQGYERGGAPKGPASAACV